MPFTSKNEPKYSIDNSDEKYSTKINRLLNILFYSKELPNDLYTQMNMSYDNYRKVISILKQKDYIKKLNRDSTIGYILTTAGKRLVHQSGYEKYADCFEEESRAYDITRRRRRRQFAYLYALLDRAGIPYERFSKPKLSKEIIGEDKIYFYTALDFKRMMGIEATAIAGSRILGFLVGQERILPVYRTNHMMNTFGSHEGLIPDLMKPHFSVPVDTAILICDDKKSVSDITNQIIENNISGEDTGISTAKYRGFYVFASDDSFHSCLDDIYYSNHTRTLQIIMNQLHVSTSETSSSGQQRIPYGNGFIGDSPVLIFPANINIVQVKEFIRDVQLKYQLSYIVCKERDVDYIKEITPNLPVKIIPIKEKGE